MKLNVEFTQGDLRDLVKDHLERTTNLTVTDSCIHFSIEDNGRGFPDSKKIVCKVEYSTFIGVSATGYR